ncbi:zinc finger, C3HC4 type [Ostertagia ostertagi]
MNLLMRRTERVQEKLETIVQLERLSRTPFEVTREHFTCSICYEIFNNAANVNPCNHVFCRSCILTWVAAHPLVPTCPECRAPIRGVKTSALINSFVSNVQPCWSERSRILESINPVVGSLREILQTMREVAPRVSGCMSDGCAG